MSCICRRCQRVAAAMESDLMADVDTDVADVIDVAFRVAHVHGAEFVGLEHVVHAMTSHAAGCAVLAHAGIDIGAAREAAADVMADCGAGAGARAGSVGGGWDQSGQGPRIDADVEAALALAANRAWDLGYEAAGLDDLVAVLLGYEPGDGALAALFEIIAAPMPLRRDRRYEHDLYAEARSGQSIMGQAGLASPAAGTGLDAVGDGANAETLGQRLQRLELRTQQDHERIVHAVAELTRQRERLPAAEDWRSQMQELAGQIDRLVGAQRSLETRVASSSRGAGVGGSAPASEGARGAAGATGHGDDEIARRFAGLVGMMERQARELERIAAIVARLEAEPRPRHADANTHFDHNPNRSPNPNPVAGSVVETVAPDTGRGDVGDVALRAGGSGVAQSGTRAGARSRSDSRSASRALSDGRRRQTRRVRQRRRSRRSFRGLRHTSIARLGLRARPQRRERSWWPWLGDRDGWRRARSRGGRFGRFGERFGHQARRPSGVRGAKAGLEASSTSRVGEAGARETRKRFYLSIDDDIVDAPSIGPKTAERLRPARIFTVRDLLDADADEVASIVTARHITAQAVRDWQDQARMVLTVPFLRGTHAQLLVGAGFRTYEDLALADQATLMSALLRFATTREGQSILRNGPPPDLEKVLRWMENALESEPARAA